MRLIDADANREDFKKIVYRTLNDYTITTKKKFNLIIIAFDNITTAYDVSKVEAELKNGDNHLTYGGIPFKEPLIKVSDAIDIVRKGGVE